ncbi:DUF4214 domain-containing protein [Pseudomonas syringae]|uniref:DUF4214 domain-containing protein n=1 Tax=Pseudomonas syringae TaxID=317 RepID=A0A085VNX2_PSESX|nr:DUF4214 domain-containing protein [Pseudomonas syringae]KFE57135.1 hypothetical protein IV01_05480 [Pseudomonas syringae]
MARITFNQPLDNFDLNKAAQAGATGQVVSTSSTHIVFSEGNYKADLSGIFPSGNSQAGVFTGITYSLNDTPYVTISGLNVKVSDAANTTSLFSGNDQYIGSNGNDHFYAWPGNDTYSGNAGIDTVHYSALKSDFTVSSVSTVATVKGLGKTDTLFNIERVNFQEDGTTLALDVLAGQNAGSAYRLYQAAFDRKADTTGMKLWTQKLDAGVSLADVAMEFVNSNEFKTVNPNTDSASLINSYYQHVLHRAPDATGLAFWSNQMANGAGANDVLASFSESNENVSNTAAELQNGIWM